MYLSICSRAERVEDGGGIIDHGSSRHDDTIAGERPDGGELLFKRLEPFPHLHDRLVGKAKLIREFWHFIRTLAQADEAVPFTVGFAMGAGLDQRVVRSRCAARMQ
jgi:hypothetical protein